MKYCGKIAHVERVFSQFYRKISLIGLFLLFFGGFFFIPSFFTILTKISYQILHFQKTIILTRIGPFVDFLQQAD